MRERGEIHCHIDGEDIRGDIHDISERIAERYILTEAKNSILEMERIVDQGYQGNLEELRAKAHRANSWIMMATETNGLPDSAGFHYEVKEFSGKPYAIRK